MSQSDGQWTQDTPFTDMEVFVGATEFKDLAGLATFASAGAGLLTLNLAATQAGNFFANVTALLKRTGVFATPALTQQQYGTSLSLPGPQASLANSNDPEGIRGFPPYLASQMPTLKGAQVGAVPKGVQINSVDLLYAVATVNATLAQMGLTATNFVDNVAPAVTNIIALGANGMPVAFRALPYRFNVAVAAPAMIVTADSEVILNIKLTAAAGGTAQLYGAVLKCSFNFN